jgi:hypothetical protein
MEAAISRGKRKLLSLRQKAKGLAAAEKYQVLLFSKAGSHLPFFAGINTIG